MAIDDPTTSPHPATPDPTPTGSSSRRRAAFIATALTVPVVVLLAFAFTAGRNSDTATPTTTAVAQPTGVLPAITLPPVAANPGAAADCVKVISALPTSLVTLQPRLVRGAGAFVKAWGEPAVVVSCGVTRPVDLVPGSADQIIDTGPLGSGPERSAQWLPKTNSAGTVWTTIDRAVYVQVTVPTAGQAADVLPALSDAVASVLPAICQAYPNPPPTVEDPDLDKTLCVYRK